MPLASRLPFATSTRALVDARCRRAADSRASASAPNRERTLDSRPVPSTTTRRRRSLCRPPPLPSFVASAAPDLSASEAVDLLLEAVASGNEQALLDFVSEEAAVAIAERTALRRRRAERRSGERGGSADGDGDGDDEDGSSLELTPLTLDDVVRAARPEELSLDSFAVRCLTLSPKPLPSKPNVLSGLSVSPSRFVARASVELRSGEQVSLTLELVQEERAASHYRSVRTERHWVMRAARGEPGRSAGGVGGDAPTTSEPSPPPARDRRDGPELVLESFLSALSSGDGAAVSQLVSPTAKKGSGARMLADALGASQIFSSSPAPPEGGAGSDGEGDEGDGEGESVPPWHRDVDGEGGDENDPSPSSSEKRKRNGTRFPRELEPLVALFLSGSSYDVLSLKMLSAGQAWAMTGVRPFGDDGRGFILGGPASSSPSATSPWWQQRQQPESETRKRDTEGERDERQPRERRQLRHPRAAFIFRLELSELDGCWEVCDVARVGGGGWGAGGGDGSDDEGGGALFPLG